MEKEFFEALTAMLSTYTTMNKLSCFDSLTAVALQP